MDSENIAERYERLCREYENKFGEQIYGAFEVDPYTEWACDLIERCIERGTPMQLHDRHRAHAGTSEKSSVLDIKAAFG